MHVYVLFCSKCGCECQEDTINEECSKDGYHYFIQAKWSSYFYNVQKIDKNI